MNMNASDNNPSIAAHGIQAFPFYTEGPAADSDGNIFCTMPDDGKVMKINPSGDISVWATASRPNGQIVLPGGDHLICDSKDGTVMRFDRHGKFIRNEIENGKNGELIQCPNDLISSANGGFYFTDSVRYTGKVFFVRPDGGVLTIAANLDFPNGLAITGDHTILYVAESYRNRILSIHLDENGLPSGEPLIFATLPVHSSRKEQDNLPDGLALDHAGNLWVAHYGMQAVHILSPFGILNRSLDTGFRMVSNLFFIEKDRIIVTGGYDEPAPGVMLTISSPLTLPHNEG